MSPLVQSLYQRQLYKIYEQSHSRIVLAVAVVVAIICKLWTLSFKETNWGGTLLWPGETNNQIAFDFWTVHNLVCFAVLHSCPSGGIQAICRTLALWEDSKIIGYCAQMCTIVHTLALWKEPALFCPLVPQVVGGVPTKFQDRGGRRIHATIFLLLPSFSVSSIWVVSSNN